MQVTIPLIDDDVEEAFYETLHVLFYLSRGGGLYEGPLAVATIRLYDFGDGQRMASYNLSQAADSQGWKVSVVEMTISPAFLVHLPMLLTLTSTQLQRER